ncbi:MAG: hypothetical protein HY820_11115 [Acidobacteria bacterium]|nr:hypothetical protein [Acidobacteriota bacterium]
MSRGWESKDVESQQAAHQERRPPGDNPKLTVEEIARRARRESLELDRKRVLHDIETVTHERYRQMLRRALAHIDGKLKELGN